MQYLVLIYMNTFEPNFKYDRPWYSEKFEVIIEDCDSDWHLFIDLFRTFMSEFFFFKSITITALPWQLSCKLKIESHENWTLESFHFVANFHGLLIFAFRWLFWNVISWISLNENWKKDSKFHRDGCKVLSEGYWWNPWKLSCHTILVYQFFIGACSSSLHGRALMILKNYSYWMITRVMKMVNNIPW